MLSLLNQITIKMYRTFFVVASEVIEIGIIISKWCILQIPSSSREQDNLGFPLISFYFLLRRVDCSKSHAINFRMIIKIFKMAMRMMD